jgi:NarL family two-component system response regulator LiaR
LGYLLKDSGPEELVRAIRQVHCGDSSLHPAVARKLLEQVCRPTDLESPVDPLTDREKEVLQLVAQGQSNHEIADRLAISEATVRTHVSHILAKLELSSRTQAALYALRKGLASLEDVNPPS